MTPEAFQSKVTASKDAEFFESIEITVDFPSINIHKDFKGVAALYEFYLDQASGWEKLAEEDDFPDDFKTSLDYFLQIKNDLIEFVNPDSAQFLYYNASVGSVWRSLRNKVEDVANKTFTYDCSETAFLLQVYQEKKAYFKGAFNFITDNKAPSDKNTYIGAMLAYEFIAKEDSKIFQRKKIEWSVLNQLKRKARKVISDSEHELTEQLNHINKEGKDSLETFTTFLSRSEEEFKAFDTAAKKKVEELEKTYEQLLKLKKPAEYWRTRADDLKKEGWKALCLLIFLVVLASAFLVAILLSTPEGLLASFTKDTSSAIKWSIGFITLISFMAFGIRILNRMVFSAFHLTRDAEEREQLTYVYLSLIRESAIDEKEKHLIMQSLFSRADTGLLKEDSSPTMPNDFLGKILNK